ncbi:choice-of-anchor I family protein [uncultured Winogradskyella sp.]|uniref:choice-of-anchor I family protein n=1 Tax=uncultured Winogradskyella sp. TaxID=395353 RepID=UPI00260255FE|nr:choice-of-anchor I family protein [uncultured Winogradskyella sp.]
MKFFKKLVLLAILSIAFSCQDDDDSQQNPINTEVNFQFKTTINVGGEGASEISAFDPLTSRLYTVNVESNEITVNNINNLDAVTSENSINLDAYGAPNSISINNGRLAVAVEANPKQNPGSVLLFDTADNTLVNQYTVGALPDMVTFSADGKLLLVANEGEPNDDYTNDPLGSISIIEVASDVVTTLDFMSFNGQESILKNQGFRVFGPNASLAQDVEPEYIAVSDDNTTAWVSLQENNGIARIDLVSKTIIAIYPLGHKDYSLAGNEIDASDEDNITQLRNWPVYGMYQPDGITHVSINGIDYVISANEGDSREYEGNPGYVGEDRVKDINLDTAIFSESEDYQNDANLGRLKIALSEGDIDNDGDYEALYSYGARSFSIWSANGDLVYDSGNNISQNILNITPDAFADNRSDDKAAEPEAVEVLNIGNERYILFVGLERTDQVMVYDITNPSSPSFLSILSRNGDEAPEGLLVIPRTESPNGKDLLVVSNEDSGTVTIYENNQ